MKIKTDKILHFVCGYAIALTIGLWSPTLGLIAGTLAAAAKELIYDKLLGRGSPEWADFLATVAGSLLAFAISVSVS